VAIAIGGLASRDVAHSQDDDGTAVGPAQVLPFFGYLPAVYGGAPAADVWVTIRPSPSIRVEKNSRLAYELRVRNYGRGDADRVLVTLPYDNQQLTVRDSRLDEEAGDFVSQVTDSSVTVTFGPVTAGEERTGALFFLVDGDLADDSAIAPRATYSWNDARGGGSRRTNFAPVLVGSFDNTSPFVFVSVEPPTAPRGTTFRFFSDRFNPNERINVALELVGSGERFNVDTELRADDAGVIRLDYNSIDVTPGAYAMYFFGERSQLTAVAEFFVNPNP